MKYTFKSDENEFGYYNKVQFKAEDWVTITEYFIEFLRGQGYVLSYNQVLEMINDKNNEYIKTVMPKESLKNDSYK